jgi:putative DNA primase/helicase
VRTRLDAKTDKPWLGRKFRHKALMSWATDNRGELIAAALTLIRGWICGGRPPGTHQILGSFESWSRVMGGILEHAEIPGFLENLASLYSFVDSETAVWHAFVGSWWDLYGDKEVAASRLFDLAAQTPELDLGPGNERSRRTVFGKALGAHQDRVIGDCRIQKGSLLHGIQQWHLAHMEVK